MLNNIIGIIIIAIVNLCVWRKLLDEKINFKDYKLYVGMIFMASMLIANFFLVNSILKTILVLGIVLITVKYVFNIDFKRAIVVSIINQLLYIISEVLVIIAVLIVMNIQNNKELVDLFFGTIYANIMISVVVLLFIQFPFFKKIYDKALMIIKNEKTYRIVVGSLVVLSLASLLFNLIYYFNNLVLFSCVGLLLLICYLIFITKNMVIRNNYLNMYVKYNNTVGALKSYEEILDKYKVSNHENKNQLLTIRHMISNEETTVTDFIDKVIKNEYQDDEQLMLETSKIPAGGLRALIYSKLIYMKNNNINFLLKVDRKIRGVQLLNIDESTILDICKVIGVFLDNAIEETKKISNGNIGIELYIIDNKLGISISNVFEGNIDLDKMDEMKYTTKGDGHGYGLTLVKEIINKNSKLENIRMINDNVFIQILKLDI